MAELRTIAVRPGDTLDAVWELFQERECDPHPGNYSLRHSNGALHRDLRNYNSKLQLKEDAKEEGFNLIKFGNHILNFQ